MEPRPSTSKRPIDDVYGTSVLGGIGERYSRLIATRLFTKAAFEGRPFKLAIELQAADKFDDVAFYNEATGEWWLIQAKHSLDAKELTRGDMFPPQVAPATGDFAMAKYFKSYVCVKQNWQYGGEGVRPFLFTNRRLLEGCVDVQEATAVDNMMKHYEGIHVELQPTLKDRQVISNYVNGEICDALVKLFSKADGKTINVLSSYPKLVSQVLTKDGTKVIFSKRFLEANPKSEFYNSLKTAFASKTKDLSALSVSLPKNFPNIWSCSSEDTKLTFVDDSTVREFFSVLVLSESQPNVEKLAEEVQTEWTRWMKSWIRPDVFRRLTEDQLREPFNTFEKYFNEWEQPCKKTSKRRFMTHSDGTKCLESVRNKLNRYVKQYDRHKFVGLDAVEKYYVNRWITHGKRQESSKAVKDEEFVEWLYEDWSGQQSIVLYAKPGMGKTTLWQHLAFSVQQKYADVEVLLIYLNDLKKGLLLGDEEITVEHAVKLLQVDGCIKPLLDKQQKVVVFMDAFDELRKENKQPILKLINAIKNSNSNMKFLISSRKCCKVELECNLQLKRIDVVPFDDDNRRDFFRLFWNVEDDNKFDEFLNELLRRFEEDTHRENMESVGLPLTMKMLGEVFRDSFETYSKSSEAVKPEELLSKQCFNIIFLYEQFTRKCIALTLNKAWKLDISEAAFDHVFEPKIKHEALNYQLYAMLRIPELVNETHKTQQNEFINSIKKGQEESLLLATAANENSRFAHSSYEEYFCAKYLYDQLSTGTVNAECLERLFEEDNYVRNFFLKMLDTSINTMQQGPDSQQLQKLLQLLSIDKIELWSCVDNCGKILSRVLNVDSLRSATSEEGSLLHLAAHLNACESMKALLEASTNIDIEDNSTQTPLATACGGGNLEMVKLLVEAGANVNEGALGLCFPYSEFGFRQKEIAKCLISHGANESDIQRVFEAKDETKKFLSDEEVQLMCSELPLWRRMVGEGE